MSNSRKVLSLVQSYDEFLLAKLLGDKYYYTFIKGTLSGLFCLSNKNVINLLAIYNDERHNGQFLGFIELLEKFARDNDLKLMVGEIFNDRLDKWFERRGYIKDRDNRVYRELV